MGLHQVKRQIGFCTTPDRVRLAYATIGRGPALVVPAAWVSDVEMFWEDPAGRAFWERLAQRHLVLHYDKQGCGLSDRGREDFSLEKELWHLKAVVEHLGLDRFSLLGYSQGGPVAVKYAVQHPHRLRRLILYATFANGAEATAPKVKESLASLVRAHWGMGSKALADIFVPGADAQTRERLAKFQRKAATAEMAAKLLEAGSRFNVSDLLSLIDTPTVVMHRQGDRTVPAHCGRELAASIPEARFVLLDGDAHLPWEGDADSVLNAIAEALGDEPALEPGPKQPLVEPEKGRASGEALPRGGFRRQLRAILSADAAGYSRLMGDDEAATVKTITAYQELMSRLIERHRGQVVDSPGDNLLAEFSSAVEALECAVAIQRELRIQNEALPENRRMRFRIGLNVGDVIIEKERLFGHGVNIAARLEGLAEAGGVCVSGTVYDQVKSKLALKFESMGEQRVKNISEPVRVYRVIMEE